MAEEAEELVAPPVEKSGGMVPKLVNAAGIFLLTLGAVVAGGYINSSLHPMPELKLGADGKITVVQPVSTKHGEAAAGAAEIYYAIDPPLVVNFEDGAAVRFLQITMEVMTKDQKAVDAVQKNVPLIRNNLLLLMSNRDYQSLMSREGKEKLRQEALAEVNSILKKQEAAPIDDLLFTSFVVQ